MAKIALMTIFQVPNYGSVLQAYATQKVLEKSGHTCQLINYNYPNKWHYTQGVPSPGLIGPLKHKITRLLNIRRGKLANSLARFRRKYLNITPLFDDYEALKQYDWSDYILVTGSDQVWNPRFSKADKAFMLGFAPASVRKVSVSSSFACKELPADKRETYRRLLGQYAALSVREQNGADIISRELKLPQKPYVMLDPTLLLSFDEWLQVIDTDKQPAKKEPYILVYELTYSFDSSRVIKEAVQKLAREYGCRRIINLGEGVSVMSLGDKGAIKAESRFGCSVEEFFSLMRNAAVVVTNSFHGTAFAVNAGRPLLTVIPAGGDDRQLSLLRNLGIEHVALRTDANPASVTGLKQVTEYDVAEAHSRLQSKREADIDWIRTHINKPEFK